MINFNDLSAFWVSIIFTALFLLFMTYRIFKSLFVEDIALRGLMLNLDNIRYTTMFLSFLLTQYFGILGGQKWLAGYNLNAAQSMLAYIIVVATGVMVSALISTLLVQSERAMGEGNLTLRRWVAVGLIYIITAGIDFGTIYGGFILVGEELYQRTLTEVVQQEAKSDDTYEVEQYKKLYEDKRHEMQQLDSAIGALEDGAEDESWSKDKVLAKIDKDIAYCIARHWKHKTLDRRRKKRVSQLRTQSVSEMKAQKRKLESEMKELLTHFSNSKTKRDKKSEAKIETAAGHKKTLEFFGIIFGLGLVGFNLITSYIRGVLSDKRPMKQSAEEVSVKPKSEHQSQPRPKHQPVSRPAEDDRDTDNDIFNYLASVAQRGKTLPGYREIVSALKVRNDDVSRFFKNYPHYYVQEGKRKLPSEELLGEMESA